MANTNERDIMQCFEEIAKYDLPAETVERHLHQVREQLTDRAAVRPERKSIWRTVLTSRWAGLAAAAVIILALAAALRLFPSPRLQAAELLTQVAKNMNKLGWWKVVTETYGPDQNQPVSVDDHWTDVANKRAYAVYNKKYIHLMDYRRKEWWVYRPDTNDMIIKNFYAALSPERLRIFIANVDVWARTQIEGCNEVTAKLDSLGL